MIIYIPIRGPELLEPRYDQVIKEYERFLNDFTCLEHSSELGKLIDEKDRYRKFKSVNFSIIYSSNSKNEEDDEIFRIKKKYEFFRSEYNSEFLKISLQNIEGRVVDVSFAKIEINHMINKLSLLVNLTYGSKIDFISGIIISTEGKYLGKTDTLLSTLEFAYKHAVDIGWPVIKPIKLEETLKWFMSNNLHTDDISKNSLHRAVNAFSYQFSSLEERDTSALFWTMLGIEALLAEGTANIIGQIKSKSSIILGQPIDYKKKLNKLYNYRSRFIHGDIDFPAKFSADYENFEVEYWDYLNFASSILLELIRTLIVMNKNKFVFEYRLSEN